MERLARFIASDCEKDTAIDLARVSRDLKLLFIVSALFLSLCVVFVAIVPPHEGDSTDYAAVARNILRYREVRENFIKDFTRDSFAVSHPASARGAFFPFIILPFYMLFGMSILTVAVPGALGHLLTVLCVYAVGIRCFERKTAFAAALTTLFCLPFVTTFLLHEPCEPDVFQGAFYLLTVLFFLKRRYAVSGLFFALAFLTKQSSLAVAAAMVVWFLVAGRKTVSMKSMAAFFATAFVFALPFFMRNQIVFHNPIYSEQMRAAPLTYGPYYKRILRGDSFSLVYDYKLHRDSRMPHLGSSEKLRRFLHLSVYNCKILFFGLPKFASVNVGLIDSLDFWLLMFLIPGCFVAFRSGKNALFPLIIATHCAFFFFWPVFFTRYLIPVYPLIFLLSFDAIQRRFPDQGDILKSIVIFLASTETAILITFMLFTQNTSYDNNFNRLSRMRTWASAHIGRDERIAGFPSGSLAFLWDRGIVVFPDGDIATLKRYFTDFDVHYVYYSGDWKGDRFPFLTGLTPVLYNAKSVLFRVDPDKMSAEDDSYMGNFRPYRYFFVSRFNVPLLEPMFRNIRKTFVNLFVRHGKLAPIVAIPLAWIIAIVLYTWIFYIFHRSMGQSKRRRIGAVFLVFFAAVFFNFTLGTSKKDFPLTFPDISIVQLMRFIGGYERTHPEKKIAVATNARANYLDELIENHPDGAEFRRYLDRANVRESVELTKDGGLDAYDLIVYFKNPPEESFKDTEAVEKNARDVREYIAKMNRFKDTLGLRGYSSLLFNGGVILYRNNAETQ